MTVGEPVVERNEKNSDEKKRRKESRKRMGGKKEKKKPERKVEKDMELIDLLKKCKGVHQDGEKDRRINARGKGEKIDKKHIREKVKKKREKNEDGGGRMGEMAEWLKAPVC